MPSNRTMWMTLIFWALILTFAIAPQRAGAQDEAGGLLARINNLRASVGLGGYALNGALNAAAQSQAQWMVETGQISHTRPDGSGPRTRAVNAGYSSTDVSENIYGGSNANADVAWNFWVNSAIHYAGLTNRRYNEVGIGIARGSGRAAYVLVFGNSGGGVAPAFTGNAGSSNSSSSGSSGGGNNSAPAGPPVVILGLDEMGNIMHQVQPGDTLGDIALIYGYTWDDIPQLMSLNNIADVRDLDIGSTFLVPPRGGTFTPTPGGPTATHTPTVTPLPPTITPYRYVTATPAPQLIVVPPPGATAAAIVPTNTPLPPTPGETLVAMVVNSAGSTNADTSAVVEVPQTATNSRNQTSPWLIIAVATQVLIVVGAGLEFARRSFKRNAAKRK